MSDDELSKKFIDMLDECLESVNADGSIIGCKIDRINKKVYFEFDLVEIPEDDFVGFWTY